MTNATAAASGSTSQSSPSTANPLFREEVFAAKRETWLGQVVLVRPLAFSLLTVVVTALALATLAYLFWGEYTRKAKVAGYVVPTQGLIKVASQQTGLIADLRVREGQTVAAGDVLAVLNTERATSQGGTLAEVAKQLVQRRELLDADKQKSVALHEQQAKALRERIANVRTELQQVEGTLRLQQERMGIGERLIAQQRRLAADKFISELALQQKEQERLADLASLENLKRSRTGLLRDLASLDADLKALPVKHATELSALERNLSLLEQDRLENESRREVFLTAPQAGVVTAIALERGKLIGAGQPLLNLIPAGSAMQVDVYVPSRAAGFIREGAKALLQYQSFPYQKFGSHEGRVTRVSRTAVAANELPFPAQQGELFYVVTVVPAKQSVLAYGKEEPLQSGMLVEASVLLDRRTLFEWVFEPLYSITGRWGA